MFDLPIYIQTLSWLGAPRIHGDAAWIERSVPQGGWDARGSWPYGSWPNDAFIHALMNQGRDQLEGPKLLSWTGVIRPDSVLAADDSGNLNRLRQRCPAHLRVLKQHLACMPDQPSPRLSYSRRTRSRIRAACAQFEVDTRCTTPCAHLIASLQDQVRKARSIPHNSSPDLHHFAGVEALVSSNRPKIRILTLRDRLTDELCGALILLKAENPLGWHAHTAVCTAEARLRFGSHLLFDTALELSEDLPIWWGGQPSGSGTDGLWTFKSRFSNHTSPAYLLSLDLDLPGLQRIRAGLQTSAWLPDYRDPSAEMRP